MVRLKIPQRTAPERPFSAPTALEKQRGSFSTHGRAGVFACARPPEMVVIFVGPETTPLCVTRTGVHTGGVPGGSSPGQRGSPSVGLLFPPRLEVLFLWIFSLFEGLERGEGEGGCRPCVPPTIKVSVCPLAIHHVLSGACDGGDGGDPVSGSQEPLGCGLRPQGGAGSERAP